MRPTDFFAEHDQSGWPPGGPGNGQPQLDEQLLARLRQGPLPDISEVAAGLGLLDLVQDELEAYGTGGGQQLDDREIAVAMTTLEAVTTRLGCPLRLPFRDFTRFRSYWNRNDGYGSWQARRDMVEELLAPTRAALLRVEAGFSRPELPDQSIAALRDPAAIQEQIGRIQRAVVDDPPLAVGSAKELVESTAKAVLLERGLSIDDKDDLPALVSKAQRALALHPSSVTEGPDGTDAVKKILGGLMAVTTGLAELRNRGYGTGHGASGTRVGLRARHGHLAVNASITWCQLMLDTLADPNAPWRKVD
ncbi:abortive infection family protein [Nocardioides marmotae]|uniref:abortive infection family protein n=1 Tax=Nocardioides marmotae TaxID=2663857 RepID=UPI0012B65A20|nr:abortive infection family protein [Nocardioides marmotae]MBC9733934.1 abortive infection family protein [Nocardioides marmotae]MTB85037.1 hypothetical protein [Nocardioides marmotae]